MPPESHTPTPKEDLNHILVSEDAINARLIELGQEITEHYRGREVAVVAIINGAVIFVADLIRQINLPVQLDCIRVSSYRDETRPVQEPDIIDRIRLDLKGVDVLLIDDILDTGKTLAKITEEIKAMEPASLKTCVLLDKQTPRTIDFNADYVGFEIPDEFVVGYGLDFAERYRHLPCIGVLKPELQNPPQWA
ncbi:MAG: hypoxanthine phosphoribosyltransferase [Coraliomargarita sp.]|nr:hypoxanthine phosphoribosyltransferase [Coraliomargarita sp.]